jgi:polysaccharide export outer membrane protein
MANIPHAADTTASWESPVAPLDQHPAKNSWPIWLLLGALLMGCHGSMPVYRATALPASLMAPPRSSWRQADLARLAVTAAPSEQLRPGDLIELTIATGLESESPVSYRLRVGEDGHVNVPLVGPVAVAGLTLTQAEQQVRDESIRRGTYVTPNVSALLVRRRSNRITVAGAVRKPGTYELPVGANHVLAALAAAEGITDQAGTWIEVRHPPMAAMTSAGPMTHAASWTPSGERLVVIDVTRGPERQADLWLDDGATVVVLPKEKQYIFVNGLVRKPDRYELPDDQDLRLLDALALAGGRTLEIADKVKVIRRVGSDEDTAVIHASVREASRHARANIRLAPGDVVIVEETPLTFVVGTIQNFVRFGFTSAIPGL